MRKLSFHRLDGSSSGSRSIPSRLNDHRFQSIVAFDDDTVRFVTAMPGLVKRSANRETVGLLRRPAGAFRAI
jgi:hypothetical protein